jgi:hypothetical protein
MKTQFQRNKTFNLLSEDQKKAALESGLGPEVLHDGLRFAIPIWWVFQDQTGALGLRSGSTFLVDPSPGSLPVRAVISAASRSLQYRLLDDLLRGAGVLAITAAHVFRGYCEAKGQAQAIVCQLGNALFDPEAHLIACNDGSAAILCSNRRTKNLTLGTRFGGRLSTQIGPWARRPSQSEVNRSIDNPLIKSAPGFLSCQWVAHPLLSAEAVPETSKCPAGTPGGRDPSTVGVEVADPTYSSSSSASDKRTKENPDRGSVITASC